MSDKWWSNLEAKFFTVLKNRCLAELAAEYPKIRFTTAEQIEVMAVFPTVYYKTIETEEAGSDLTGEDINALNYGCQIEVYTNQDVVGLDRIMDVVIAEMKKMRFSVASFPVDFTNGDIRRSVARFRRLIGNADAEVAV